MRAIGFSKKILFGEIVNVKKYPVIIFQGSKYKWLDIVICNHGNRVVGNGMKWYSTNSKDKGIKPRTSYNLSYKYGTPHPESNIPNVVFTGVKHNETKKEKVFREYKQDLMSWHHSFWLHQNQKFTKEKKEYTEGSDLIKNAKFDGKEKADDLSLFYKEFLDKNFSAHFQYQREWYRRNFLLLWYGLRVDFERLFKKLTVKMTRPWSS